MLSLPYAHLHTHSPIHTHTHTLSLSSLSLSPSPPPPLRMQANIKMRQHKLECMGLCAQAEGNGTLATCLLSAIKEEMWGICKDL